MAASFSRPQVIRGGLQAFEKFMTIEKARFNHAPVVLISGPPAPPLSESSRGSSSSSSGRFLQKEPSHYNHEPIEKAARQIELLLRHKLRLQTITTQQPASSSSYDFPTPSDVQNVAALADRVGASTLVAVGSGFHMDLAKAVAAAVEHKHYSVEQLVLVPTSLGAAQASTASHALLLDPTEEALLVQPPLSLAKSSDEDATKQTEIVVAQIEDMGVLDKRYKQNAILASLTVALDCIYRDAGDEGSIRTILEQAGRLLLATTNQDAAESADHFAELSDLCYLSGELLSYGSDDDDDSLHAVGSGGLAASDHQFGAVRYHHADGRLGSHLPPRAGAASKNQHQQQ